MLGLLGDGTFGRVLEVEDIFSHSLFAMKVIRPVARYIHSAKIEYDILTKVNQNDIFNASHAIRGFDAFTFDRDHVTYYAIIFEELGKSLYDFLKENGFKGYPMSQIQRIAKQVFEGIGVMHRMGLIHTDLKPENLMFTKLSAKRIENSHNWPINVRAKVRKTFFQHDDPDANLDYFVIKDPEIRIIDFGGAIYIKDDDCHGIINTRQYRSPEVILNCQWNEKSDVWGIACILAELYTGEVLFDTHENEEHLCLISKVCGSYPEWMIHSADSELRKIFHQSSYCR